MIETVAPGFTFEEGAHRYVYKGVPVPSVTQVLDRYSGLEYVAEDLLERARQLGTHVHKAVHLFNEERLELATLDPVLQAYLLGWQRFLDETGAVVIHSEQRLLSRNNGFAGTLDSIVHWGKSRRLVDVKTATAHPRTVGPQTAAYAEAWKEVHGETIRERYSVLLTPDGRYNLKKCDDPRDWNIFRAALTLHRWLD